MREKSIVGLGAALLLVAIFAAYSNHFHNSFHYDDGHTIVNNAAIRELRNIPFFFRDATTFSALPSNQSYRPVVSTLLAIDYRIAHGLQPFWFHLSIFALFIVLTLLLGLVIYHLLDRYTASSLNLWIALAAAGWYALHPANADAINYIIVVDEDCDVHNTSEVLFRLCANTDPARDSTIIRNPSDSLDHAPTEQNIGSHMGLDATRKLPGENYHRQWPELLKMTDEARALVNEMQKKTR